jgi:tetratricopeptide (TPR) repeat protein
VKNMLENLFTEFINYVYKISEVYRFEGRFDEAMLFFDSLKPILDFDGLRKENKARILIQFAKIRMDHKFFKDFDYNEEMKMLLDAQDLAESTNAKNVQADALDLYGNCIYRAGILEGEFEEALKYYKEALSIRTQIQDKLGIIWSYFHLGIYHENKKDPDEKDHQTSFDYFEKGLKIALEENFKLEQSYLYRHLAGHYAYNRDDLDKGLEYFKKSAELREEIGFIFSLQFAYFAIGFIYFIKKEFDIALKYFKKTFAAAEKVHRIKPLMVLIHRRGDEIVEEIDLDAAINFYNLMINSAKSIGFLEAIEEFKSKIKKLGKKE